MASASRRGMDWPTAWRALVPVYGLAAVLHSLFPAFAVPAWAIFMIYGFKVLDGARGVRDPWAGRMSPRIYLIVFLPLLVLHLFAFTVLVQSPSFAPALIFAITLPLSMGAAAAFVAASGPPSVRAQTALVRTGFLSEIGSALANPLVLGGILPFGPSDPFLWGGISVALAVVSLAAFLLADRTARRTTTIVARKARRKG